MSDVEKWFKAGGLVPMRTGDSGWQGAGPSYVDRQERRAGEAQARANRAIVPIPDESQARIDARRRRAIASKTGRESTILTGLGG